MTSKQLYSFAIEAAAQSGRKPVDTDLAVAVKRRRQGYERQQAEDKRRQHAAAMRMAEDSRKKWMAALAADKDAFDILALLNVVPGDIVINDTYQVHFAGEGAVSRDVILRAEVTLLAVNSMLMAAHLICERPRYDRTIQVSVRQLADVVLDAAEAVLDELERAY